MTIPLIWPRSGTDLETLHSAIERVSNELSGGSWPIGNPARGYVDWAFGAVQRLQPHISSHDLDRLVRTPTFWSIVSRGAGGDGEIHSERQAREEDLRTVLASLGAFKQRFENLRGGAVAVVVDTSLVMFLADSFAAVDWRAIVSRYVHPHTVIHLILPLVVVDELDNLKDRGHDKARGQARVALRLLHESTGGTPGRRGELQAEAPVSGRVTLEVLMESPERTRLPINDDEIVDVAARLRNMFGDRIITATCDTGFDFRAAAAGLKHVLVPSTNRSAGHVRKG